jgi:hypothetical protein
LRQAHQTSLASEQGQQALESGTGLLTSTKPNSTLPQETSLKPFALGELIRFLDAVERPGCELSWKRFGFVLLYSQCNLDCGGNLEEQRDFISVSSDYYPALASHYRQVTEEWYAAREQEKSGLT